MPKGYARKQAAPKLTVPSPKSVTTTGKARALSNPGASKRSAKAMEMLRKNRPAIKKMAAARKARKKKG